MKTAEVILENEWNKNKNNCPFNEIYIGEKIAINNAMIEFAKMHVQEVLKQASEKAQAYNKPKFSSDINPQVDMKSILNAYSLGNIK